MTALLLGLVSSEINDCIRKMLQNMLAGFSFVFFFSYFSNDCPLVEMSVLLEVEIIISNH